MSTVRRVYTFAAPGCAELSEHDETDAVPLVVNPIRIIDPAGIATPPSVAVVVGDADTAP